MKTKSELTSKMEQVKKDIDRDYWMSAEETLKYGIIDKMMSPKKK